MEYWESTPLIAMDNSGESPFSTGKSTTNGPFSIAKCQSWIVHVDSWNQNLSTYPVQLFPYAPNMLHLYYIWGFHQSHDPQVTLFQY